MKIVDLRILVDDHDLETVMKSITAQVKDVDFEVFPAPEAINTAHSKGEYIKGMFILALMIYSPNEESVSEAGWWSERYGWTSYDLATRYPQNYHIGHLPMCLGNDAKIVLDPHQVERLKH